MRNNKDNSEKGYWVLWVCWREHQSWRRSNGLEAELSQEDAPPPPEPTVQGAQERTACPRDGCQGSREQKGDVNIH